MNIRLTMTVLIPASDDSLWFTEEDAAGMTDAEIRELLDEDLFAAMEGATWTITREP